MSIKLNINAEQMEQIIAATGKAFHSYRYVSRYTRSRLLAKMAEGIESRRADLVKAIVTEVQKPATLAEAEVSRAVVTFTVAAEEAKRYGGDIIPLDIDAGGRAYSSMASAAVSFLVPRGPVLAITPFNFPLNLVAHKVAPALAIGATVILKPPPQGPGASKILQEIFEKAREQVSETSANQRDFIPQETFQVFTCSNDVAAIAIKDQRIATLSFTGSNTVGWMLQSQAIRKKVCLELGGNASVIVHSDVAQQDALFARAVARTVWGSFAYAGQVCISVQNIFVHKSIYAQFEQAFIAETKKVVAGDPSKKETLVGPLIDDKATARITSWIDQATKAGAKILTGGKLSGTRLLEPTVLKNVPHTLPLYCEEAFGPIVILEEYENFSDAIKQVNASKFGLQAGVFTDSAALQQQALQELEVGGVIFNDVPTYRADNMPYGGVKESGLGREGVRYTMEEFSERRTGVYYGIR